MAYSKNALPKRLSIFEEVKTSRQIALDWLKNNKTNEIIKPKPATRIYPKNA